MPEVQTGSNPGHALHARNNVLKGTYLKKAFSLRIVFKGFNTLSEEKVN